MSIVQTLELNIIPDGAPQVIHVNQNDTGTGRLMFCLKYNDQPIIYSNSVVIKLRGTKPNGQTFEKQCHVLVDLISGKSYVVCDLTTDMDDIAGDVYANIEMTDGDERVGTQAFIMRVQQEAK